VRLVLSWIILTVVVAITVLLVPGIKIDWVPGFFWAVAGVLAVVNVTFGLIMRVLEVPLLILTWGLPVLLLNAVLIDVAGRSLESVHLSNSWVALVGAAPIALVAFVVEAIVRSMQKTLTQPT
jgi:putative membrane protein